MTDSSVHTKASALSADTLTTLWYFFTSTHWAALLLALLALTAALSALQPYLTVNGQSPLPVTGLLPNPGNVSIQTGLLSADSGTFDLYRAFWFRFLLGLFAFTLLLRLVDRFDLVFQLRQNVSRAQSLYFGEKTLFDGPVQSDLTGGEIQTYVRSWPGSRLVRTWHIAEDAKTVVYMENLRVTVWGDWLLHLGCLVVIIGVFVTAQWGWFENNIALAAGESHEISQDAGYLLTLARAVSPQDACVKLTSPDGESQEHCLSALKPYLTSHFALFQVSTGPALRLSVEDASGESLLLQPLVQGAKAGPSLALKFREAQDESYLFLPKSGVTIRVDRYQSLPEAGYDSPVYLVRAYRGNQSSPLFSHYVGQYESHRWQGITFTMSVEDYVVLNVVRDVGWWFVLAGLLLLVVGSVLRQWSVPWLARLETREGEDDPLAFRRLMLWGRRGFMARDEKALQGLLRCVEAAKQ